MRFMSKICAICGRKGKKLKKNYNKCKKISLVNLGVFLSGVLRCAEPVEVSEVEIWQKKISEN